MSAAAPKLSLELPLSQHWCCSSLGLSPKTPGWESGSAVAHSPLADPCGVTAGPLHLQPCSGNQTWVQGQGGTGGHPARVLGLSLSPGTFHERGKKLRLGLGIFFQKSDKNNSLKG